MGFFLSAAIIIAASACIVMLVRRSLGDRETARKLRAAFISIANDLVGKPEFPDAHARQLVTLASVPEGWLTRYMVMVLFKEMLTGSKTGKRSAQSPRLEQLPDTLRAKYVTALLAYALSDSYRSALCGRIWRGAYSWIPDAVQEVKPDVNAHATRNVVEQMGYIPASKRAETAMAECLA